MLLAATIASIVFLKSKTFGLFLWLLAILVGLGRILALVHHPIDIIASAVIAIVATVIAYYASYILPKSSLSKL
jgi:membrane-associated phospholipid phosphatase